MTDDDVRNYHRGLSFEHACRCYAGMVETGEVALDRIRELAPAEMVAVLNDYFQPDTDKDDFVWPVKAGAL